MYVKLGQLLKMQDSKKRKQTIKLLAEKQVWQCPTLIVFTPFDSAAANDPIIRQYSSPDAYKVVVEDATFFKLNSLLLAQGKKVMQLHRSLVKQMADEGVPLLTGTDVGNPGIVPGYSLHAELGNFVKAGISPLESLRAATINPAIFLDQEKVLGTVEKGKFADLVLLDANPLEKIENTLKIYAVILNGHYISRRNLDSLLDKAKSKAND